MSRLYEIFGEDMPQITQIKGLEEIRLRRNTNPFIKASGKCEFLDCILTDSAFERILDRICRNSYHAHAETVRRGYINAGDGIRVGVSGRAVTDRGSVINIVSIENLTVRVPHIVRGVCQPLFSEMLRMNMNCSVLIYSPPGVGKTTLLRDIALRLTSAPVYKRVALLDAREELYMPGMNTSSLLSLYSGYPKDTAIEASVRTMSPDYILTDEIGSPEEAEQLRRHQNSGVSFIATAHASKLSSLLQRPAIAQLYRERCFDLYCGISRKNNSSTYQFSIHTWKEARECLKQQEYVW